jgi:DNA-binding NtrC family response regulator
MQRLRALVARAATRAMPVLIQGPSGSGKELIAKALHDASGRCGNFVALNVCAIPDSMFESAMFGHVRGAFTGATGDTPGFMTEADGGTLFLDEIGALALGAQAKLLRAVETGVFRPVGARNDRRSIFRIVAATNEALVDLVNRGSFRADLGHRLRGCVLNVPPLRDRLEDVPALAHHFIQATVANDSQPCTLTAGAIRVLAQHTWPGNVRELRSVLDYAVMISDEGIVDSTAVDASLRRDAPRDTLYADICSEVVFQAERAELVILLEAAGWDAETAAMNRGVSRATIYRWMRRLRIKAPRQTRDLSTLLRAPAKRDSRGSRPEMNGSR